MKNIYTIFAFVFSVFTYAQFGSPQFINSPTDSFSSKQFIRTADVDNDGNLDILVGSSFNNLIRYFHNEGNLAFALPVIISGTWTNLSAMETSDLNNDGTPDIITLDKQSQKLFWQSNLNGNYSSQILIKDNLITQAGRILSKDFNGDSNNDIVILNHFNVLLFFNDGEGNFSEPIELLTEADETEIYDNVTGYFNDDAFLDIAISNGGFAILLNDESGNFSLTPSTGTTISFLLESADYNNDGLSDVLMDGLTLVPYHNSVTGFSIVGAFSPNNENYQTLFSSDLDNDGDFDVISEDNQTDAFFWYENINDASLWIRHNLQMTSTFSTIYGVSAADLDGDGDPDLIRTSCNGEVAIYENQLLLNINKYEQNNFKIFPNPAARNFAISTIQDQVYNVEIYDLLGKKLMKLDNVESNSEIDISHLEVGHYCVQITGNRGVVVKKLLVNR